MRKWLICQMHSCCCQDSSPVGHSIAEHSARVNQPDPFIAYSLQIYYSTSYIALSGLLLQCCFVMYCTDICLNVPTCTFPLPYNCGTRILQVFLRTHVTTVLETWITAPLIVWALMQLSQHSACRGWCILSQLNHGVTKSAPLGGCQCPLWDWPARMVTHTAIFRKIEIKRKIDITQVPQSWGNSFDCYFDTPSLKVVCSLHGM